jgi:hypothetical protein
LRKGHNDSLFIFLNTSSVYPRPLSIFSLADTTSTRSGSAHLALAQSILIIATGLHGMNIVNNAAMRAVNAAAQLLGWGVILHKL